MEPDLEYQNTRAFDRDVFNAMFMVKRALHDDDGGVEPPDGTAELNRNCMEAWAPSPPPAVDPPAPQPEHQPITPPAVETAEGEQLADILDRRAVDETAHGHLVAARALHEQAVEIRRRVFGEADPRLAQSFTWIGNLALRENRLEEAWWLHEQARRVVEKIHGPEDLRLAIPLHNLGVTARSLGDLVQASDLYDQALAIKLQHLGWMHTSVATTLTNLGNLSRLCGDRKAALCYYARARDIFEKTLGGVNPGLASVLVGIGRVHLEYGAHISAIFMFERAVRIREAIEVTPTQLAGARLLLATALKSSRPAEAREVLQRAIADYARSEAPRTECAHALLALAETLSHT